MLNGHVAASLAPMASPEMLTGDARNLSHLLGGIVTLMAELDYGSGATRNEGLDQAMSLILIASDLSRHVVDRAEACETACVPHGVPAGCVVSALADRMRSDIVQKNRADIASTKAARSGSRVAELADNLDAALFRRIDAAAEIARLTRAASPAGALAQVCMAGDTVERLWELAPAEGAASTKANNAYMSLMAVLHSVRSVLQSVAGVADADPLVSYFLSPDIDPVNRLGEQAVAS